MLTDWGFVWANILHYVNEALVEKYGFSTVAMTYPDGSEGNIVFLHLFIDALALQPAEPTCEPNSRSENRKTTKEHTLNSL